MFKRVLLVTLGLTAIGGTALACNEYSKPKVEKISIHNNKNKDHEIPCTQVPTDAPLVHNPHCQSSSTSPSVSPKPTKSPQVTPAPTVTPSPTPVSTPAASQTVKSAAPAVLPSVGGSGRLKP
jgi:hypothetical protein